jgi:GNAT superfamily N-acetyltransferase
VPEDDPVAVLLDRVAAGVPPPADGRVDVVPQPPGPVAGILAFAAHHVVAADVDAGWVAGLLPDGDYSAPVGPTFVAALAARLDRSFDNLDLVLVAEALDGPPPIADLEEVPDDHDHPRVERARRYRSEVRAWEAAGGDGLLVLGRGLAGRWEAAFEVEPRAQGRGLGRALARCARHLVPDGRPVWAQVAPGNVPSLRAALAAGFAPVGAEILFAPHA